MSEEDIFPTFNPFGPLKDVAIIRDKHTGLHRGCAFVTYWSGSDAERAQEALHDNFTFPGARRPAQVKPAEPSGEYAAFYSYFQNKFALNHYDIVALQCQKTNCSSECSLEKLVKLK